MIKVIKKAFVVIGKEGSTLDRNLMYQWNFRDSNPMLSEQERTWN